MGNTNRKKSLHDVLRERRAASPLLSVRELQLRETALKAKHRRPLRRSDLEQRR